MRGRHLGKVRGKGQLWSSLLGIIGIKCRHGMTRELWDKIHRTIGDD